MASVKHAGTTLKSSLKLVTPDPSKLSGAASRWTAPSGACENPQTQPLNEQILQQFDALYNFAHHLTNQGTVAEDLVQETFVRALSATHTVRTGSNVKAWLFCILRNAYIDWLRRQKRHLALNDELDECEVAADAKEPLRGDAELAQLRRLVAADIEAALSALNAESRTVILLDWEGFSEREIAEVMSIAGGTVKSRLARARAAMRKKLWEYAW
ncbi:MAG TPA: RNA polymerase sigma factor [Polyangiaceae bacterium]